MWVDRDEDFARRTAPDTVRFERLLPGPVERIWAYLTDSEKRQRWLASGPMELRPGGAATLHFRHSDFADDATPKRYREMEAGVTSELTIIEIDPPRLLAMTWPEQDATSEVTFELFPEGSKVALVVTHRRLPDGRAMANVSGGWHAHLMALEAELGGRPLDGFWANMIRLEDRYRDEFSGGQQ